MPAHRKHPSPGVGDTFGLWEVTEKATTRNGHRRVKCRCSCGFEKSVDLWTLIAGRSKCCRKCTSVQRGRDFTIAQFWKKVQKTKTCWLWTGAKTNKGYGNFWDGKRNWTAHKFAWELSAGRPMTHQGNHICDVPACVRPSHVYDGTQRQNVNDAISRGRRNPRGHQGAKDSEGL